MAFRLKLKTRTEEVKQDYCEKCGQFGHTFRDCGMGITCYKCGKEGHHGRNCTEDIRYESVAVESAKQQGIYTKESRDAFYDKSRDVAGNWNDAAAKDNQAEDDALAARPRDRTEADFADREHKTYSLVPSAEKDAAAQRAEAKQRLREEREAQAIRDANLIATYKAKLDKKKKKEKKAKKEKKKKKRARSASTSAGFYADGSSASASDVSGREGSVEPRKEKKVKKEKRRREYSESDDSDDSEADSRRKEKKAKKEKKGKKEKKERKARAPSSMSDDDGSGARKRRRSDSVEAAPPAKRQKEDGLVCGSCGAVSPSGSLFCGKCGKPFDTSDEARAAREQQRTDEREAKRQEELRRKADEAKAAHDAQLAKKKAHLERVMQSKTKRQGPFFTAPSWAEPREDKTLYLSVERGGKVVEALDVSEHPYYLLGKNADVVDFPMEHESVSRVHVALIHDGEKNTTYLEDLNSKWGVKLDGRKVTKNTLVRFDVGSAMQVGGSSRLFCLKERSVWD